MVESHKNLVDSMEHWIQQDASLLAMTNEVDYDQDGEKLFHVSSNFNLVSAAYAQQLEDMIAEKQEQLATLRDKTRAFRSDLRFRKLYIFRYLNSFRKLYIFTLPKNSFRKLYIFTLHI